MTMKGEQQGTPWGNPHLIDLTPPPCDTCYMRRKCRDECDLFRSYLSGAKRKENQEYLKRLAFGLGRARFPRAAEEKVFDVCKTLEGRFQLRDVVDAYDATHKTPLAPATVGTYLARLVDDGRLVKPSRKAYAVARP